MRIVDRLLRMIRAIVRLLEVFARQVRDVWTLICFRFKKCILLAGLQDLLAIKAAAVLIKNQLLLILARLAELQQLQPLLLAQLMDKLLVFQELEEELLLAH